MAWMTGLPKNSSLSEVSKSKAKKSNSLLLKQAQGNGRSVPGESAACKKKLHSNCFKLNCSCGCHKRANE